jgi:hypothetical protein
MPNADLELALTSQDPEELQRLYQKDKHLAPKLLENINTPQKLLLEIIQSEYGDFFDTWLNSASVEVLRVLAQKIPELLVPAPKKFWQRGTSPQGLTEKNLVPLLREVDTPEELLIRASTHPSEVVRDRVAAHQKTPASVLRLLTKDPSLRVTATLARNLAMPPDALLVLARQKELRYSLAQNPSSPEAVLRLVFEHQDLSPELAVHPNTPGWMKERLFMEGNREVLRIFAASPKTPEAILVSIFQQMQPELCSAVLRNPSVPVFLLEKAPEAIFEEIEKRKKKYDKNPDKDDFIQKLKGLLYELQEDYLIAHFNTGKVNPILLEVLEGKAVMSAALAKLVSVNELTTTRQLEVLAKHADAEVRKNVAQHPKVSKEVILRLVHDTNEAVRESAMQHASLLAEDHENIAKEGSLDIRLSLVRQADTHPSALCYLLGDWDLSIRQQAVAHKNLLEEDSKILKILAVDQEMTQYKTTTKLYQFRFVSWDKYGPWLRHAGVKQNEASSSFLMPFLRDPDLEVRQQAFLHPNMLVETLVEVASEPMSVILGWILDSSTPKHLEALARLREKRILTTTNHQERSRGTPLSLTKEENAKIVNHIDANVRQEAARNPNTPSELLEVLAYDHNRQVRHAVAGNLKTPDHILFALLRDPDAELCRTAQMTMAQKVGDYSPRPGWIENAPFPKPKLLRVLRLSISERTVKNIKDAIQRDPSYLRKRVTAALQRAKEKNDH